MSVQHPCPWPECPKRLDRKYWGCGTHWFKLPKALRDKIWGTWGERRKPGGNPQPHIDACAEADRWIEAYLNKEKADGATT